MRELATEGESKDPEKVSFAMPQQGVLPMSAWVCLPQAADTVHRAQIRCPAKSAQQPDTSVCR
jgi:hypothetical protein